MAKNDVDKLHKQKGEKNKPITRMKAERNVWVYSQLQTQGGERGGRGSERERGGKKKIMRA